MPYLLRIFFGNVIEPFGRSVMVVSARVLSLNTRVTVNDTVVAGGSVKPAADSRLSPG